MLNQPSGRHQASQRPPGADDVGVDVRVIAGEYITEVLLVSERQDGEVEQRVARLASDQSITPVTSSPSTKTWSS